MKVGYPNHPRRDVVSEIEWVAENGFDFIDLFFEPDRGAVEALDVQAIRQALEQHNLTATGHLAWYLPIGSPMVQLRKAAVAAASDYLTAFAMLPVSGVTVHANWPPGMFSVAEGIAWQIDSLQQIVEIGRELGVSIMYEPVDSIYDSPGNVEQILQGVPDLLCHLDTGHCNLYGRKPTPMIRQFADRLEHLHLHDNNGWNDLHLPLGCGNIDWAEVVAALKEINYAKTATLEIFSPDRTHVLTSLTKIRKMWAEST